MVILKKLHFLLSKSHCYCCFNKAFHCSLNGHTRFYQDDSNENTSSMFLPGLPYDFHSIMHYGAYNMAKDYAFPVMTPKLKYAPGLRLGQRYTLSSLDAQKLQRLYECPEDLTHIHSDLQDKVLFSCDFASDACGMSYYYTVVQPAGDGNSQDTADYSSVKWVTRSGMSQDGPRAGSTNGLDSYLYASKGKCNITGSAPEDATTASTPTNITENTTPSNILVQTPWSTVVVTSVVTPLLTAPDDGKACVELFIFQKGPSSYISVYLIATGMARVPLQVFDKAINDRWGRADLQIELGGRRTFSLELVATLAEGGLAVDDMFVFKGNCVLVMG